MTQSSSDISAKIVSGPQAACLAPQLWHDLPEKRKRMILWEVPAKERFIKLQSYLGVCDKVCIAWDAGKMLGMSWVLPTCPGARAGFIHLAWGGDFMLALTLGRLYYRALTQWYDMLCMFVPVQFRHVRKFIEALGYQEAAHLKSAAALADHDGRIGDAIFYTLDLKANYG